ncbi:MAG TPA: hypothetical protein VF944_10580 [Candidatus Bathyarchaeia archaeon]
MISKRAILRRLVITHPDWSYQQYATYLGQSVTSIRGALSAMGMSRKNPCNAKVPKRKKVKARPPVPFVEGSKPIFGGSTRYGNYLKLL